MEAVMHLLRPPMLFVGLGVVCVLRQQAGQLLLGYQKLPRTSFLILA